MEKVTHSLEEFNQAAIHFTELIAPRSEGATIVNLSGDLGAGKTTFVQAIGQFLGIPDTIKSPTFTIMQAYSLPEGGKTPFKRIVHIDAYRLEKPEQIEHVDWSVLQKDKDNLIFVEWPEKSLPVTPAYSVSIQADGETRHITIS